MSIHRQGTVFQTAPLLCFNHETSSRVTLASLGIGFLTKLFYYIAR